MNEIVLVVLVYALLSVIVLVIAGFIFRSILQRIWAAWSYSGTLFGDDTKTRLIGLGVSALLFPRVFTALANFLVGFIYEFFVQAPRILISSDRPEALANCATWEECFSPYTNTFIQTWTSSISDSLAWLSPNRFPYGQLVFLLATWAIVTLMFDIPNETDNPGGIKKRKVKSRDSLNDPTKQNFVFFITLALAGYLSIVSIITIPSLQESPSVSEEVKVERLEQQFNDMYVQWKERAPEVVQQIDLFVELKEYIEANPSGNDDVRNDITSYEEGLKQLETKYKTLVTEATSQLEDAKSGAVFEYGTTSNNRKGTRETIEHFSNLVTWYRRLINVRDAQIRNCRSGITNMEGSMQVWSARTLLALKSGQDRQNIFDLTSEQFLAAQDPCLSQAADDQIPERPELGSNLGAFSNVSSWLLTTESLSLAQIVGMLGFGLLGSAVTSLIRNTQTRRNKKKPIVDDLEIFIIRGATAAVVVFLAVKGGLAIFTSGSGEPNSYVLLLTCFVAAVFSEDVWKWARKWLKDRLKDDNSGDGEDKKNVNGDQ